MQNFRWLISVTCGRRIYVTCFSSNRSRPRLLQLILKRFPGQHICSDLHSDAIISFFMHNLMVFLSQIIFFVCLIILPRDLYVDNGHI